MLLTLTDDHLEREQMVLNQRVPFVSKIQTATSLKGKGSCDPRRQGGVQHVLTMVLRTQRSGIPRVEDVTGGELGMALGDAKCLYRK